MRAVVVGVVCTAACALGACGGGNSSAVGQQSCAPEVLSTKPDASPASPGRPPSLGTAARSDFVVLYGRAYLVPCDDTASGAERASRPPALSSVQLALTTSGGRQTQFKAIRPRDDGSFTVRLQIPASAALGPATITDHRGHTVSLMIAA